MTSTANAGAWHLIAVTIEMNVGKERVVWAIE